MTDLYINKSLPGPECQVHRASLIRNSEKPFGKPIKECFTQEKFALKIIQMFVCICVSSGVMDGCLSTLALLKARWGMAGKPEWAQ